MQYNITYREKDKGIQFIISYKDADGKWKQKSKQGFKSKKEAKAAAEDAWDLLKKELENQKDLNQEYKGITFKGFSLVYIEHERLYKEENTIELKEYALKKFSDLDDMELDKITNMEIQKCVDKMVMEELSRRSIINYLSMIKAMFNNAIDYYNMIKNNPVKKIMIPEEKEEKAEKKALTQEEFKKLLSKIDNFKLYTITMLAGSCGLRIGEILGLRWDDLDEINATLRVKQQLKRVKKKSKHGVGKLKSKNSYRRVPVSDKVMAALKKYDKKYPRNIDGRIFDLRNTSSTASRLAALYKSLSFDISVHELRHTYATLLISNGTDFKTVAKLMGHSVNETIRTYSHVTDEMMERAVQTIRSIF